MKHPRQLKIVIKIGTSSIVDETTHEPILPILSLIVDTAIRLKRDGHKVVIVSSGAIGVGLQRMNIAKRPKHLPQTQALAAIGQCRLISIWDSLFAHMNQPVAQILLTRNDIADSTQRRNAQNTFKELLKFGVIPIVNENDTLAVSEIKFGDNDTLSAHTAAMIEADYLFLMTDVEALYDKNPRLHADAKPITTVEDIDALQVDVSSRGSDLGTGGMATKIIAARLATSAGTTTIITKSSKPGNIKDIIRHFHPNDDSISGSSGSISEPPLHTRFVPSLKPVRSRDFRILHGLLPQGIVYIDRGAARALRNNSNLFPPGIVDVEGDFAGQEAVRLVVVDRATYVPHPHHQTPIHTPSTHNHSRNHSPTNRPSTPIEDLNSSTASLRSTNSQHTTPTRPALPSSQSTSTNLSHSRSTYTPSTRSSTLNATVGEEIGRALSNYSASQLQLIKGLHSSEISRVLGYADTDCVAFRDHVSLSSSSGSTTATSAMNASTAATSYVGGNLSPDSSRPVTPSGGNVNVGSPHHGPGHGHGNSVIGAKGEGKGNTGSSSTAKVRGVASHVAAEDQGTRSDLESSIEDLRIGQ